LVAEVAACIDPNQNPPLISFRQRRRNGSDLSHGSKKTAARTEARAKKGMRVEFFAGLPPSSSAKT